MLLICRTTRFDKDDVPDLSRLGRKSMNEPHGKSDPYSRRSDEYGSRSDTYGRDSHREGGSSADNSFSGVREKVQMGIATSHSHTEMLQDMVLNLSEGASRRDADHDKSVLKDLVKEMVTFRYCTCSRRCQNDVFEVALKSLVVGQNPTSRIRCPIPHCPYYTLMSLPDCYIGLCISYEAFTISSKLLLVSVDEPCLILAVLQLDTTWYSISADVSAPVTVTVTVTVSVLK